MTLIVCPICGKEFDVVAEGVCPVCNYFYKIKSRERYKWDALKKP